MPSVLVRISERSHRTLRALSARERKSMVAVLEDALEGHRRRRFIEEANDAYRALRRDREAWRAMEAERAEWDATLMDGLDPGEVWSEDGRVERRPRARKGRGP